MKTKKTVKGEVFIIPNPTDTLKNFCSPEWIAEKCKRMLGVEAKPEDELLQIWICSEKCDNWSCTFGGFQSELGSKFPTLVESWKKSKEEQKETRLLGYFPEYVPKSLFEGKKEGDVVTFTCPEYDNVEIALTLNQLGYRYKRFGRFEEVFEKV